MDGVTTRIESDKKDSNANVVNSPLKIIIKKENIGLEEYQHQKFQYNLFNQIVKNDHYYDDLCKVKDRLEKTVPNMQQVIHIDMKRVKTNKVFERKLNRDLTGPRGLNWQFKQELQRLENDERDVARDLMRLNRDIARIASSSPNRDLSRSQTPRLSVGSDMISPLSTSQNTKLLARRSLLMTPKAVRRFSSIDQRRPSITEMNPYNEKSPWLQRRITSIAEENSPYRQRHARTINQQKKEVEQKLKQFLL